MSISREVLRHDVGEHVGCRKVCGFDGVPFAGITDDVEADTDVLGVLRELRVLCVTLGLYHNRSVERIKGNQATFDNSQRNNLRSCMWVFRGWCW